MIRALQVTVLIGGALALSGPAALITMGRAWTQGLPHFAILALFFAVFVWMASPNQFRNPVVWVMAASSFFGGLYIAGLVTLAVGIDPLLHTAVVPADLPPAMAWILVFTLPAHTPAFFLMFTLGLLLFPDGRLPSPRWRAVAVVGIVGILIATLSDAWVLRPDRTLRVQNPTEDLGVQVATVAAALSVVALIGRFRRSRGVPRQQFKWIMWGASVAVLALLAVIFLGDRYEDLIGPLLGVAVVALVTSYGIAVGKYRLYDIDIVISRTVVYGTLAVFITGVYIAVVVGLGSLLSADPESSPWLAISATGLVAFAFEPLRERLQRLANRLVYGTRATPYQVLSDFSRKITATDEELLNQVARSLAEGTTAAAAAVWVSREGALDQVTIWPVSSDGSSPGTTPSGIVKPEADLMKPVIHDGEFLGALTLSSARGQALLPTDERLLDEVASGMGLALRNIRLNQDLHAQIEKLGLSRQRLVSVRDEARRQLERQLHDGAQQRLVALKVRVALTRKRAEASAVSEVTNLLDDVAIDTGRAIDSLRDFARGVYPPLLEAEGPAAALTSQTPRLPVPVIVHAAGLNRHQRSVEAAVYFCVLEALQNVVKHAEANSAHVTLHETDDSLTFEVSDDGRGFDSTAVVWGSGLANLADRLDALEGTLEVTSSPGKGTTVRGRIPSRLVEPVA